MKLLIVTIIIAGCAATSSLIRNFPPPSVAERERPDIAVVVFDDIGEFDVADVPTPTLDTLKNGSVFFPAANTTSSLCSPSRIAITGLYSRRFDVGRIILKGDAIDVPPVTTIASLLAADGYTTGFVGKWHLSSGENYALNDAPGLFGFDDWRAVATHNPLATFQPPAPGETYFHWGRVDDGVYSESLDYITTAQTDAAIQWWGENPGPKFLWLSYTAPHAPFHEPPASALPSGYVIPGNPTVRDLFEAMVASVDFEFGRLIPTLSDAYVIAWSDNGTPSNAVDAAQDPSKVKASMFEGGVGTFMYARSPMQDVSGLRRRLVSSVDVFGTVLDIAGVTWNAAQFDAMSFADELNVVPFTSERQYAFAERYGPNGPTMDANHRERMVRDSLGWKLIVEEDFGVETFRGLFYIPTDRNETISTPNPAKEAELQSVMDSIGY